MVTLFWCGHKELRKDLICMVFTCGVCRCSLSLLSSPLSVVSPSLIHSHTHLHSLFLSVLFLLFFLHLMHTLDRRYRQTATFSSSLFLSASSLLPNLSPCFCWSKEWKPFPSFFFGFSANKRAFTVFTAARCPSLIYTHWWVLIIVDCVCRIATRSPSIRRWRSSDDVKAKRL